MTAYGQVVKTMKFGWETSSPLKRWVVLTFLFTWLVMLPGIFEVFGQDVPTVLRPLLIPGVYAIVLLAVPALVLGNQQTIFFILPAYYLVLFGIVFLPVLLWHTKFRSAAFAVAALSLFGAMLYSLHMFSIPHL